MNRILSYLLFLVIFVLLVRRCNVRGPIKQKKLAGKVGDININILLPFQEIKRSVPMTPDIRDGEPGTNANSVERLTDVEYGGNYINTNPLIEFSYYAYSIREVTGTAIPVRANIRSPFRGRLLGVYLHDSPDSATRHVRKYFPNAYIKQNSYNQPGEWDLILNDSMYMFLSITPKYKNNKPVKEKFDSILFFINKNYKIVDKKWNKYSFRPDPY